MSNTAIMADLLKLVADGIRVMRTRDGIKITDEQIAERSNNIVCALTGLYEITEEGSEMKSYFYWVAASSTDNTGVGDTGTIDADTAQEAAEIRARQLSTIPGCDGQVVRARSDDVSDTGESTVKYHG